MTSYTLQTVARAVHMLRAFDGGASELTISQLTSRLHMKRINVLRLAKTLEEEGVLAYDPHSRRYGLSMGCLALCAQLLSRDGLVETSLPHMTAARDATGESVCLMVREGWHRTVAASVHSRKPVRYVLELGEKRPVFMGASGQCLISALSASEWRELEKHISESEEARKRQLSMEVIRERLRFLEENGWAFGQGEWASEAAGAAAPIRNKDRSIVAAVTVAVPLTRASAAHMESCGKMALATARSIESDYARLSR